jgi:hypothetical protein
MAKQSSSSKHSAPVEMTEEEVRAAREGRGTHKLPAAYDRKKKDRPAKDTATKKG